MDELEIYVNVEELSDDHIKWKREVNRNENIYQNKDTCHAVETNRIGPALSGKVQIQIDSYMYYTHFL